MQPLSPTFVTAGRAVFTISNSKGRHYTYRVTRKEASEQYRETYLVELLKGPDNTADYADLVILQRQSGEVILTRKSHYTDNTQSVRVIRWALGLLWRREPLPEGYHIYHEGRCGRCRRRLTVPESIEAGFGPQCIKLVAPWKSTLPAPAAAPHATSSEDAA
jgi:hypothetical protein